MRAVKKLNNERKTAKPENMLSSGLNRREM
jgi:hypothetical protein